MKRAVCSLLSALLAACVLESAQSMDPSELLFLYDRMGEPIFTPKGKDNVVFDISQEWMGDRYKSIGSGLMKKYIGSAKSVIPVRKIKLPDFSIPKRMGKSERFSYFLPEHRRIATSLINIFMSMRSLEDFQSAAVWARSNLNPSLFAFAMSVALLHREDTKGVTLPSMLEVYPRMFIEGSVFAKAREESAVVSDPAHRVPIIPSRTANSREPESVLAYFREDVGLNLHHWHWHLVYPAFGDISIVNKDRRGELFYYMHEQMLGRYDFERFSNRLGRVTMIDLNGTVTEGYYSKLYQPAASKPIPGRPSNLMLSDIHRDGLDLELETLVLWEERLLEVARTRSYVTESGQTRTLGFDEGIDALGNMVEASLLSLNDNYYGDLHNQGHITLAAIHDPDGRHLESLGVMGDTATACRDPIFYRWHKRIDNIFQEFKRGLPPYTAEELAFDRVKITSVEVETLGAEERDVFETFWQQNDVELSRGLNFFDRTPVFARLRHIDHKEFTFKIKIENRASRQRAAYVRIFMAPRLNESGAPLRFDEQRTLMVELDRFPVSLKMRNNNVQQSSTSSSVTIPFERTFRSLDAGRPSGGDKEELFNSCGCGWPQHMLIPKGTPEGLQAQLFVMVTDYSEDKVDQPVGSQCSDAASYCGVYGQKYPDKRPMGFPFDRPAGPNVVTIYDFLKQNMFLKNVVIKFNNIVEPPPPRNASISTLPILNMHQGGGGRGLLPTGLRGL